MNWTNRSRARASDLDRFVAAVFAACAAVALSTPARAQTTAPDLWFAGTRLVLAHPQEREGTLAVATDDAGLARFLGKLGATLAYDPGQRYVVVTAGDRHTIAFAVGDARYTDGGVAQSAAFAPYARGNAAYLPFLDLARALGVEPVDDGGETVLQPQIASLDVRTDGRVSTVTLHGAAPLRFKRLSEGADERLTLAFSGTSSTLDRAREVGAPGLRGFTIVASGTARNPTTTLAFDAPPGATHALVSAPSPNEIAVAFAPAGVALGGMPVPAAGDATLAGAPAQTPQRVPAAAPPQAQRAAAVPPFAPFPPGPPGVGQQPAAAPPAGAPAPAPPAAYAPAAAPAATSVQVTGLSLVPGDGTLAVRLSLSDAVAYQWHRLPDNRWYVDLQNATLAIPSQDEPVQSDAVVSLRLKQIATDPAPVVRLALTLASPRAVSLQAADGAFVVAVDREDDLSAQRTGAGTFAAQGITAAAPVPATEISPPAGEVPPAMSAPWKFAPSAPPAYAAPNPRLIVIDPGHGGSDTGAMHNGLVEKELTLDISKRLRSVLTSRGWLVKMTRDTDVDVYAPNDSARDELQARDDVANQNGARMLISVHINSFTSSSLDGTTTYYYKGSDLPLAQAVHRRLMASLGTTDDGVRKENFYVIHHAAMPATLVETAFLSNAGDAGLLRSPAWRQKVAVAIADGVGDYAGAAPAPDAALESGAGDGF